MTDEFKKLLVLAAIAAGVWYIALFGVNTIA